MKLSLAITDPDIASGLEVDPQIVQTGSTLQNVVQESKRTVLQSLFRSPGDGSSKDDSVSSKPSAIPERGVGSVQFGDTEGASVPNTRHLDLVDIRQRMSSGLLATSEIYRSQSRHKEQEQHRGPTRWATIVSHPHESTSITGVCKSFSGSRDPKYFVIIAVFSGVAQLPRLYSWNGSLASILSWVLRLYPWKTQSNRSKMRSAGKIPTASRL
ncbi:hypothetical protein CC86DRAFT_167960 [Ophiobolus disseminans]|uniref:Uncharacterized protein n=1 Tax=Ophiobolus disseminans TaxID=1469910 RepID=A0A6A7ADU7_9PLEO|nr:hypothetical protein CC86DRAFT_167960 [Ophiobolus disseminans]